ncbi:[4Fe-4S] proteins maturation [Malassezia equina]|uniref:[4Fe-4S] proteins maturation n=1 Tax=Malassezia equina TaxID=1381935 RepID=A0AAF0EBK9_9BASI|nr:[4Fe-4S] proteins maturation [Malassezia equina]
MPPLRFGVPSRGFVTILRKPEHPEDTTALEGDVLGVLLTDRAIEVRESFRQQIQKLRTVAQKENDERLGLRVGVEPGGCHGYVYKLELTSDYEEDDLCVSVFTERGARVIIDSVSLGLIKGSTIDYVTELIGSQFAIKENPQAKGNGCGCGVSWEPIL